MACTSVPGSRYFPFTIATKPRSHSSSTVYVLYYCTGTLYYCYLPVTHVASYALELISFNYHRVVSFINGIICLISALIFPYRSKQIYPVNGKFRIINHTGCKKLYHSNGLLPECSTAVWALFIFFFFFWRSLWIHKQSTSTRATCVCHARIST